MLQQNKTRFGMETDLSPAFWTSPRKPSDPEWPRSWKKKTRTRVSLETRLRAAERIFCCDMTPMKRRCKNNRENHADPNPTESKDLSPCSSYLASRAEASTQRNFPESCDVTHPVASRAEKSKQPHVHHTTPVGTAGEDCVPGRGGAQDGGRVPGRAAATPADRADPARRVAAARGVREARGSGGGRARPAATRASSAAGGDAAQRGRRRTLLQALHEGTRLKHLEKNGDLS